MIVLDAAALVDVLADEPVAPWVLDHLDGQDVIAPAHQIAEVLSAVSRLRRAGTLTDEGARDALVAALGLEQELIVPTVAHVQRAYDLSGRIRVLDGLYVAIAEERGVPLLTTDERLARSDPPCEVLAPPGTRE